MIPMQTEIRIRPFIPNDIYNHEESILDSSILDYLPIEGIACLVVSAAIRIFSTALSVPFLGMGVSMIATHLALKTIEWYDEQLVIDLSTEVLKVTRNHPNLQLIAFAAAMALSFFSKAISFASGLSLGCFGTVIMNVGNYRQLQETNRKK